MQTILLAIHLVIAFALVGVILLQRSEGGALGIGGGGPGGMMSARGAANFLTKITTWLAIAFVGTSMALTMTAQSGGSGDSVLEQAEEQPVQEEQGPTVPVPD